jgi:putative salt-induced outer membrane protein YdiY
MCIRILLARRLLAVLTLVAAGMADAEPPEQAVFEPPPDNWDWVQLTSDEWLKGELIAFYEETLEFDSDNLGILELDWEDVRRLRTHATWGVAIEDSEPLFGVVEVTENHVIVRTEDAETVLDRDRLVSIAADNARELALWRASISLGANIRKGNSDVVEYTGQVTSRRLTPVSRIVVDYIGNYNRTEGIEVANKHRVTHSWDRFKNTRSFWRPIFGQYYRDPFQNIEHQASLGGGYGWHLVDTSKTEWDFSVSAGAQYVWYVSALPGLDEQELSPAGGVSTEIDIELTDWLDYLIRYNFFVTNDATGRFKHHLLTEIATDVWEDLEFKVTLVWDRTQEPQPRADNSVPEQDDFFLVVGLEFNF